MWAIYIEEAEVSLAIFLDPEGKGFEAPLFNFCNLGTTCGENA